MVISKKMQSTERAVLSTTVVRGIGFSISRLATAKSMVALGLLIALAVCLAFLLGLFLT